MRDEYKSHAPPKRDYFELMRGSSKSAAAPIRMVAVLLDALPQRGQEVLARWLRALEFRRSPKSSHLVMPRTKLHWTKVQIANQADF
jgi:hypothetical protein